MSETRLAFSRILPGLQIAWDSTSIGERKTCDYKYKLSIDEGWATEEDSIDLDFGIYYHRAKEAFERKRVAGASHQESVEAAVITALTQAWNADRGRPWSSTHPNKNRGNLIRSVVWYCEQFKEEKFQTILLPSGEAAVEVPFSIDIGYKSRLTGEPFLLCGRLGDRIVEFNGEIWVVDTKSTKSTINRAYWNRYSPDNQVSCYSLAGTLTLSAGAEKPRFVAGVIIDASQIGIEFTRNQREFIRRSPSQLQEWLRNLHRFFSEYEYSFEHSHFPQNDKACGIQKLDDKTGDLRYGCQFREVCASAPEIRSRLLELNFKKRFWDPLKRDEGNS